MAPSKPAGAPRSAGASATHPLATALQFLKGVGQRAKLLANLGLDTVEDALDDLPLRHEDRSQYPAPEPQAR